MYKLQVWFENYDVIHRHYAYGTMQDWIRHAEAHDCDKWQLDHNGVMVESYTRPEEDDGQPDEYTEWQDYMGGDDWDHGQYDDGGW